MQREGWDVRAGGDLSQRSLNDLVTLPIFFSRKPQAFMLLQKISTSKQQPKGINLEGLSRSQAICKFYLDAYLPNNN